MRIEESIEINRPPEDVFAFFDDRRNDSRWMETVVSSEWVDDRESTGLGRPGRMVMYAPRLTEFYDEVIEYEPGRKVGHRSASNSMIVLTACYAEPIPGGTRATVTFEPERLPGGLLGRLAAPFIGRTVRRNYRADLTRLKEILENETETTAQTATKPQRRAMSATTDPTSNGTHPNAILLRKGKEAFLRGEIDTVEELLSEDLVVHTSGDGPFEREYQGRDAFLGFIGELAQLTDGSYRQELHDVIGSDDHAVALVTVRAERNGKSLEYRSAEVFHLNDGRATEAWFLNDNPDPDFWA